MGRIDFSSDYFVFFAVLTALVIAIAFFLERASPKKRSRRRIDQRGKNQEGGELID